MFGKTLLGIFGKKKRSDDDIVRDVIARYGEVIDLRRTPHLILEILRIFGGGVVVADAGVSVAGVGTPPAPPPPPPPPPSGPTGGITSLGNVVDNVQIMKEILKLSKQVSVLTERVEQLAQKQPGA